MYELSTVRPHVPEGRRYSRAEWAPYCEGYYQALVMAVRVMRAAYTTWRDRSMRERINGKETAAPRHLVMVEPVEPEGDPWARPLLVGLVTTAAIFMLEIMILLAALIYRAVY